jgi:antitoxin MazE
MEAMMQVFKWDDDLAVELPESLIEKMGLKARDELDIVHVVERTLIVRKQDWREAARSVTP